MMAVTVEVCREFGLTVSEAENKTMWMPARSEQPEKIKVKAAGQQ